MWKADPSQLVGSVSKTEPAIGPIAGKLFLNLLVKIDKDIVYLKVACKTHWLQTPSFQSLGNTYKTYFQQQKNYGQY